MQIAYSLPSSFTSIEQVVGSYSFFPVTAPSAVIKPNKYALLVDELIDAPKDSDLRDLKAVKRLTTAYMKLLFPHVTDKDQIDIDDFNLYCLQPAVHRRDIVRQQCSYIDAEGSFSKPIPNYKVRTR